MAQPCWAHLLQCCVSQQRAAARSAAAATKGASPLPLTRRRCPPLSAGYLVSVDSYMNLQLASTEEFIDGQFTGNLGEVLIR